jgi:hypothetical protein
LHIYSKVSLILKLLGFYATKELFRKLSEFSWFKMFLVQLKFQKVAVAGGVCTALICSSRRWLYGERCRTSNVLFSEREFKSHTASPVSPCHVIPKSLPLYYPPFPDRQRLHSCRILRRPARTTPHEAGNSKTDILNRLRSESYLKSSLKLLFIPLAAAEKN